MVKNNKKENNSLATMIANGFDDMGGRLNKIDVRLTDVELGLSSVGLRLGNVEKKVDKLDYQVDEVYDILKRFEENDILNLQKRVQTLERVVKSIANQISAK